MTRGIRALVMLIVLPSAGACDAPDERIATTDERAYSAFSEDKHRQFDFWIGEWDVNLRMLQQDLSFADTVSAKASIFSILNGKAILELWDSSPIKGYSLRYYDPDTEKWVLWLDWPGQNSSNVTSLTGEFRHGRGEFRNEFQTADGTSVIQRYSFNDITPFSLRWDDLRSTDGGATWGKNWRMEFTRTAVEPEWPLESTAFVTYDTGARCDQDEFRPYERIVGHWHGQINEYAASISSWLALDGCAVLAFLDIDRSPAAKRFMFLTYNTVDQQWEVDYLDDDRSSGLLRLVSEADWSSTGVDGHTMDWTVNGNALEYRFSHSNGTVESGRFEQQELEGH